MEIYKSYLLLPILAWKIFKVSIFISLGQRFHVGIIASYRGSIFIITKLGSVDDWCSGRTRSIIRYQMPCCSTLSIIIITLIAKIGGPHRIPIRISTELLVAQYYWSKDSGTPYILTFP